MVSCVFEDLRKRKAPNKVYASEGSSWIFDSGCTNHLTGEKWMFSSYVKNKDSHDMIVFCDGNQGKIIEMGKIAIIIKHLISNVFLVKSLGYNLLSVSQFVIRVIISYLQMLM
jgi:hypothetical protein